MGIQARQSPPDFISKCPELSIIHAFELLLVSYEPVVIELSLLFDLPLLHDLRGLGHVTTVRKSRQIFPPRLGLFRVIRGLALWGPEIILRLASI